MKTLWIGMVALCPLAAVAQIQVVSATYGPNCGAPHDNAKVALAAACDGHSSCSYVIDYQKIGDPVPGCAKTYTADWVCSGNSPPKHAEVSAEAGFKKTLTLACNLGALVGQHVQSGTGPGSAAAAAGSQVQGPKLEITAINPTQPVHAANWGIHYRLTNDWLARKPLLGWLDAIAFDDSDPGQTHAIHAQSVPIADLQPDQVGEGDLIFPGSLSVGSGHVQLTYFQIFSGYVPGPRSADGVLPEVPANMKNLLLATGQAKLFSTSSAEVNTVASEAERVAIVFDFDTDSCLPSAAISEQGIVNPGLEEQAGGIASGCRDPQQLQTSRTYYRQATINRNGTFFAVHMYALYFMKDKSIDLPVDAIGHRHDWEYALVWTTNGVVTHASYSHHGDVTTDPVAGLDRDGDGHVKVVYHHDGGLTHAMRFAKTNEGAENDLGRFFTPTIADWYSMSTPGMGNPTMRQTFNTHDFGEADCSFNDHNFPGEIAKSPPTGYPDGAQWKAAAMHP